MVTFALGTYLLEKLSEKGLEALMAKGLDTVADKIKSPEDVNNRFRQVVDLTAGKLGSTYKDVLGNSTKYFFDRKEVFHELLKLLFYDSNISIEIIEQEFDTTTLPSGFIFEFVNLLRSESYKDPILSEILKNKEILILTKGISKDVNDIVSNTTLIKSDVENIVSFLENNLRGPFDYERFLTNYKTSVLNNLSQVHFVGLGIDSSIRKNRKQLNDIFVKPFFVLNENCIDTSDDTENVITYEDEELYYQDELAVINYDNLFDVKDNIVILGNPGTGKSILIKYIICSILKKSEKQNSTYDIPFRIELRKYLEFKKQNGGNINNYLIYLLESEYNIQNITNKNIEYIFKAKKVIIFFDGLDEIFNVNDKISIKDDIENFYHIYRTKSIVTSRIIGYEEAKLSDKAFNQISILDFDNNQIADYVNKWYEQEEQEEYIRNREVEDFLSKKSSLDKELVKNPLLLSLIVILFRNTLKLPESKLEIYQSCTKTLVDKWDATKELKIDLDEILTKKKETIFADLAFWQYEQLSSNDDSIKITYEKAKNKIASTIIQKLKITDEWIEAQNMAESFMIYAQKRSIYFDNNFTHKTFLEYFTAYWIYSNCDKKQRSDLRNELVTKYIGNSFWSIVLELLFNMIDNDQPDSEIIDKLYSDQINAYTDSVSFLLSVLPSVRNISKHTVSYLFEKSLKRSFELASVFYGDINNYFQFDNNIQNTIFERVSDLVFSNDIYIGLFNETYVKLFNQVNDSLYKNYFIFYLELTERRGLNKHSLLLPEFITNNELFIDLVDKDPYTYLLYNQKNNNVELYSIDNFLIFINKFGLDKAFVSYGSAYSQSAFISYFDRYLVYQMREENVNDLEKNLQILNEVGLTEKMILEKIGGGEIYFRASAEKSSTILSLLDSITNPYIASILLTLLINPGHGPRFRLDIKTSFRINSTYTGKYLELVNTLKTTRSFKGAFDYILSYNKVNIA